MQRPMRSGQMFGRGGMFTTETVAAKLTIAIAAISVVVQLFDAVAANVVLINANVFGAFKLWTPLTYAFALPIGDSPFMFVIGLFALWSIGSALEITWGTRRFLIFAFGTTLIAGALTLLLSLVWKHPLLQVFPFFGASVLFTATWVAYGMMIGRGQTSFWFLPVNGYALAGIGVALVFLEAVRYRSFIPIVAEVFGLLIVLAYTKLGDPSMLLLKLKHWRYQRELKSRSKHLNVVSGDRGGRGSDRYLQ